MRKSWLFLQLPKQGHGKKQSDSERHGAENSQQPKNSIRLYELIKVVMRKMFRMAVTEVERGIDHTAARALLYSRATAKSRRAIRSIVRDGVVQTNRDDLLQ